MPYTRQQLRLMHDRYQAALALIKQQDLVNALGSRNMVTAGDRHQLWTARSEYDAITSQIR